MQRIDAHQHFWKYNPERDDWITDDMQVLKEDFTPIQLEPVLQQHGFEGCVAVQADQSEEENSYLLGHAGQYNFIRAVVGWVDLQGKKLKGRLEYYSQFEKLKGFRHILQGSNERDMMLKPAFRKGIGLLKQFNFTYDILIFPDQLMYASELVESYPNQKFVVDHLAKPYIKFRKISDWKKDIMVLAEHENVYCKISGMVTEADWIGWKKEDFTPYIDTVVEAFGPDRIMFGSDWPVCLVAAGYPDVLKITEDYFSSHTQNEKDKFFGLNAKAFYNI
jgi:L-fuconolactonase